MTRCALLLLAVVAVLAVDVGSALGAPPEAPQLTVEPPVHATEVHLHGLLSPASTPSEGGEYKFLYKPGAECEGGSETTSGLSFGFEDENVFETLSTLAVNTEYTVCLVDKNGEGETSSAPVTFTTALPPEPPETKSPPTSITATSATLEGVLNPNNPGNPGSFEFLYRESASECQGPGEKLTPTEAATGSKGEPAATAITGLLPHATYSFCLLARNEAGETTVGNRVTFTTGAVKPTLESESATEIAAGSATLSARVNPNGSATTYHFEYDTTPYEEGEAAHGTSVPLPDANIGSGSGTVIVSQVLSELSPNTEYHWRLVAANAAGTATSLDHTFAYPLIATAGGCPDERARELRGSTALPDCRAYELVTPVEKNGGVIDEIANPEVPPQIAGDGQSVVSISVQCFSDPEGCTGKRKSEGEPYEFTRTPEGWITHPLAPPASSYAANTWRVIDGSGSALFAAPSAPGSLTDDWLARVESSLVNLGPLGEHAGERPFKTYPPDELALNQDGVVATADMQHVLYETLAPLWGFDETKQGNESTSLYEYAGASHAPLLVGVSGGFESHALISECGTRYGSAGVATPRAQFDPISQDGRVVYFTAVIAEGGCPGTAPPADELYARVDGELPDARSVPISVDPPVESCHTEPCVKNASSEFQDARFEGASADGSNVVFTDTQQLTEGASQSAGSAVTQECGHLNGPGGCNLYESQCAHCEELSESEEHSRRRLIDISEGAGPEGPRVQGMVAISEDGSHVYFVAKGLLTGAEENQNHERAVEGADNLYVYSEGRRAFIARLSAVDGRRFQLEATTSDDGQWSPQLLEANVTPDGGFLVFMSHRALTADDSRPEGPRQVYEYDADAKSLTRVSVGQDGFNDDGNAGEGNATIAYVQNVVAAASEPVRTDPSMSDDGQFVFFQSPVALTPGALNDVAVPSEEGQALDEGFAQNVYEFHDDEVSLISDGKDTTDTPGGDSESNLSPVELIGSDREAKNAFFATFDPLVPEDTDTQRDFYDAHVCSEAEPCTVPVAGPPALCEGEACHPAPAGSGSEGAPASESFVGAGNLILPPSVPSVVKPKTAAQVRAEKLAKALKVCRKKKNKHNRVVCEKQAKKKYAVVAKAKRAAYEAGVGARGTGG